MTRGNGEMVWSASYEAWERKAAEQPDGIHNPLRSQGQYYALETGLHHNRYRYYDPGAGAFISQDPIGLAGGPNAYQFAPNVIRWADPLGPACCDVLGRNSRGQWIDANGRFVESPPRPSYVAESARHEVGIPVTHTGGSLLDPGSVLRGINTRDRLQRRQNEPRVDLMRDRIGISRSGSFE